MEKLDATNEISEKKNFKKFVLKEVLDKVGFGFGSQQFINVLLFLSGASLFLVGIVNGLKAVLSILFGILTAEYDRCKRISKRVIGLSGILFGFSFLFMAFGKFINSPFVFSIAVILSGISIVVYGDFSQKFFFIGKKKEILEKIAQYGLIITAMSLFLSALVMDKYAENSFFFLTVLGKSFIIKLPGYLIAFEIAAIAFILSGHFLASVGDDDVTSGNQFSFSQLFSDIKQKLKGIFGNKFLLTLFMFSIVAGLVQVVGNSYYGIFIYQNFKNSNFGGFMNIAIVFLIGVFSSLIGYFITKLNTRSYGSISMILMGSLFLSLMPLAYFLGTSLAWLTAGTIMGVIGAAALGISTNMMIIENLQEQDRRYYYVSNGLLSIIPYLVLVPLFSYLAQLKGLNILFLILSIILVISTILVLFSYKITRTNIKS